MWPQAVAAAGPAACMHLTARAPPGPPAPPPAATRACCWGCPTPRACWRGCWAPRPPASSCRTAPGARWVLRPCAGAAECCWALLSAAPAALQQPQQSWCLAHSPAAVQRSTRLTQPHCRRLHQPPPPALPSRPGVERGGGAVPGGHRGVEPVCHRREGVRLSPAPRPSTLTAPWRPAPATQRAARCAPSPPSSPAARQRGPVAGRACASLPTPCALPLVSSSSRPPFAV